VLTAESAALRSRPIRRLITVGDAEGEYHGERGREQGEIEKMRQRLIAQLQQLIAGLLEHHGAARLIADHDRGRRRQQQLLTVRGTQPFGRGMSRERGRHALPLGAVRGRHLQRPLRGVDGGKAAVPGVPRIRFFIGGARFERAGDAELQGIRIDHGGASAGTYEGAKSSLSPGVAMNSRPPRRVRRRRSRPCHCRHPAPRSTAATHEAQRHARFQVVAVRGLQPKGLDARFADCVQGAVIARHGLRRDEPRRAGGEEVAAERPVRP
jgi:hypothetical protein